MSCLYSNHINKPTLFGLMSKQNNNDNDEFLIKVLMSLSFFFVFRIIKWMFNRGWFNKFL